MSLEQKLAEEADKKGLTGEAKHHYIGGTIHNIKAHTPKQKKQAVRQELKQNTPRDAKKAELEKSIAVPAYSKRFSKKQASDYKKLKKIEQEETKERTTEKPYDVKVIASKHSVPMGHFATLEQANHYASEHRGKSKENGTYRILIYHHEKNGTKIIKSWETNSRNKWVEKK